ncbi:MAG: hypothetical protein MJA82_18040 [Clostridia bacterium]|nr:hypothetical protein [Clostridia bacterium]
MKNIINFVEDLTEEQLLECYLDSKKLHKDGFLKSGFLRSLTSKIKKETGIDYSITQIENEIFREIAKRKYE